MTQLLALLFWVLAALHSPLTRAPLAPPLEHGWAFHYHPGLFAVVAQNRGMALDWTAAGFISVLDCRRVDPRRPWYADATIGPRRGWWQVVDCSNPGDVEAQRAKGEIMESDWYTAYLGGWAVYNGAHGAGSTKATLWAWRHGPGQPP